MSWRGTTETIFFQHFFFFVHFVWENLCNGFKHVHRVITLLSLDLMPQSKTDVHSVQVVFFPVFLCFIVMVLREVSGEAGQALWIVIDLCHKDYAKQMHLGWTQIKPNTDLLERNRPSSVREFALSQRTLGIHWLQWRCRGWKSFEKIISVSQTLFQSLVQRISFFFFFVSLKPLT